MKTVYKVLLIFITLYLPKHAFATLGGNSISVANDAKALGATMTVQQESGYSAYTLTTPTCTIHEYVASSSGTVFKISSSHCKRTPAQSILLGTTNSSLVTKSLRAAKATNPHSRASIHLEVATPSGVPLVHSRRGHFADFSDQSYLMSLAPTQWTQPQVEELP